MADDISSTADIYQFSARKMAIFMYYTHPRSVNRPGKKKTAYYTRTNTVLVWVFRNGG